jgi:hypothetical protein
MTADPRSPEVPPPTNRRNYFLPATALVLLLAGLAYLSNEILQRHKYSVLQTEVNTALAELRSKAFDGHLKVSVDISQEMDPKRAHVWLVSRFVPDRPNSASGQVWIDQSRHGILLTPKITVYWPMDKDPNLVVLLETALSAHGLIYDRGLLVQ